MAGSQVHLFLKSVYSFLIYLRSRSLPLKEKQCSQRCGPAVTPPPCLFWNSPSGESDAEAIIVRLNLHGRLDLSGTSAPTSWLSVRFASGDAASRSFPFLTQPRLVLLSDAEPHSEICVCCVSHGPQRGLCAEDSARNHSNFMRRAWFVCLGCVRLEMEARFAYCRASSTAGLRFCVGKKSRFSSGLVRNA